MNIFFLDSLPRISARWLCDKHTNSQFKESCQILSNLFTEDHLKDAPKTQKGNVRKHSYPHHPCCKWVKLSRDNAEWLILHAYYIEIERLNRGYKPHFSKQFLKWANENLKYIDFPEEDFKYVIAIPENSKCRKIPDFEKFHPNLQYRLYYKLDKPFATWKKHPPYWFDWEAAIIIKLFKKYHV